MTCKECSNNVCVCSIVESLFKHKEALKNNITALRNKQSKIKATPIKIIKKRTLIHDHSNDIGGLDYYDCNYISKEKEQIVQSDNNEKRETINLKESDFENELTDLDEQEEIDEVGEKLVLEIDNNHFSI